jgi:glycosyltransferase involved in cell wall biosynthesis
MPNNPSGKKQNSHLLLMNYCLDHDNQVLSHQAEIAIELARSYQRVSVITGQVGKFSPPENMKVVSINWNSLTRGRSSISLIYNFLRICLLSNPTAVFSHMTENYTLLTGLFSRILGIRHVLWYAHASNSIRLKLAVMLSNNVVTSTAGSFPFKSRKVVTIGQSIDHSLFIEKALQPINYTNAIHVGRIDPSKNLDLIISCFLDKVTESGTLVIVGKPSTHDSSIAWEECKSKYKESFAAKKIVEKGGIPRSKLSDELHKADFFLHAFIGSLDKAVIESTFCKVPVISINPEYINEFGKWSLESRSATLESELEAFLSMDAKDRNQIIDERYLAAREKHSFTSWILKLRKVLESDNQ